MESQQQPTDVGLIALEIYFPATCVDQNDLEVFNKVAKGKYTIGLGQLAMACVNDREDINSISLTCVNNLMKKNQISHSQIGRLEVGTETLLDKSKSVKTILMSLFRESGNHDVEGVTSINACYGSTNALFNSINWVQSQSWDGRYALVVSSDIAVYPKGSARPTGGVGAIAMLIGPNAPVVFDNVRGSFVDNTYDFYKPIPTTEYPTVDGHQSIEIYLNALRQCYTTFKMKYQKAHGRTPNYYDFAYFAYHTPFSKMVQKSFFALLLEDMKCNNEQNSNILYDPALVEQMRQNDFKLDQKTTKILQKSQYQAEWKDKCERSLLLAKQLGNIYTGSLYNGLISLLCDKSIDLADKKVMLFSYGSGCAATMFFVKVKQGYKQHLLTVNAQFQQRLNSRIKLDPQEYDQWMTHREKMFGKCGYEPTGMIDHFFPGTFYLTKVDEKYRRYYTIKEPDAHDKSMEKSFNWTGDLKPQKASLISESAISDIETSQNLAKGHTVLKRMGMLDSHFAPSNKM